MAAIGGYFIYLHFSHSTNIETSTTVNADTNTNNTTNSQTADNSKVKIPILMYHYIRNYNDPADQVGTNLSISPTTFEKQLKYLKDSGYQTINLEQLASIYQNKTKTPDKPIILTFDDGYDDAYTNAFPALVKHNFIGVFYIITSQMGKSQRMTKDQIIELDKAGMIIGSHSSTHPNLSTLSQDSAKTQINDSKSTLEQFLDHPIYDFCYPSGKYNDTLISLLKSAGYKTAVTTQNGISNAQSDFFKLPRIRVQNDTNLEKVLK